MILPEAVIVGTEEHKRWKAVRDAHRHVRANLPGQWRGRKEALQAIAEHPHPMRRARQIVAHEKRKAMFGEPQVNWPAPAVPKIRRSKHRLAQIEAEGLELNPSPVVTYCWPKDHGDQPAAIVDPSDVQELVYRLLNRSRALDPIVVRMVRRLDEEVGRGGMSRADFERGAAVILTVPA